MVGVLHESTWLCTIIFQTYTGQIGSFECKGRNRESPNNEECIKKEVDTKKILKFVTMFVKYNMIHSVVFMVFIIFHCILCRILNNSKSYISPKYDPTVHVTIMHIVQSTSKVT